jgi:DNA polymerase-3 subunit epsilon
LSLAKFDSKTFEVLATKSWYIRPENDFTIEESAQNVHGLTKEFILENGVLLRDIFPEIQEFLGDCDVLTYNGNNFDVGFLYNDLKEIGLELDFDRTFYDAYVIEAKRYSRTLTAVYKKYTGKEMVDAHDALADTLATIEVFKHQLADDSAVDADEFKIISPESFVIRMDDGRIVFANGKYSRKKVSDVCKTDPGYIKWVFDNCSKITKKTIMDAYYKDYPKAENV